MEALDQFKSDLKSLDRHNTYAHLLDRVSGCPDLCPCCRRPCDVDHTLFKLNPGSQYNEHACLTGHCLRAMNGYKFEGTGEASLFMCEQIQDDQEILVGPIRYRWSQFKKDHPNWKFESRLTGDELSKLHGKYLTLWEKIGNTLCQKHGMTYVTHNTTPRLKHRSYHSVFLLDASGSMVGQRWKDLMSAMKSFLERRKELETDDRITIIRFNSTANVIYSNQDISNIDIGSIQAADSKTGTSFSKAFKCVNRSLDELKTKKESSLNESFAIIFMSDGEADYPEKELDALRKNHRSAIQRFWTIALTNDSSSHLEVLQKINTEMDGAFYDVKQSADLIQTYAEVASSFL